MSADYLPRHFGMFVAVCVLDAAALIAEECKVRVDFHLACGTVEHFPIDFSTGRNGFDDSRFGNLSPEVFVAVAVHVPCMLGIVNY